jgi:aminotransferase
MRNKLAQRVKGIQQSKIRAVTKRIEAVNGVNLGQGTCPLPPDPRIVAAAERAMLLNHNSYTAYDGIPELKEALVERYANYNNMKLKTSNVLVTSGATGGFETVCKCFLEPGDEVIMFEPIYQYHVKLVLEKSAVPVYVPLAAPCWTFNIEDVDAAITEKTKFLALANPNNPSGKVFTREELSAIGDLCKSRGIPVVSDEVYEYILAEGYEHISLASLPGMFENTITISSASKTLFMTGWRVGWLIAPDEIMEPLGVRADETYVCAPAPFQHAVAQALRFGDDYFDQIRKPFQKKRQVLSKALTEAGLKPYDPQGAYYTLADYTALGYDSDENALTKMIEDFAVGAVPGNSFFLSESETGLLRFCYAVSDEVLDRACQLLASGRPAHQNKKASLLPS